MIFQILKSRTILFSLLLAALGAAQANSAVFEPYMTPEGYGWFVMAVSVAVAVLRVITTVPLDRK